MLPWCKMSDEDIETVCGGMIAGLEEISGIVAPSPDPEPILILAPTPVI